MSVCKENVSITQQINSKPMDDLHIVWIGARGVGKKTALHKALAQVAHSRNVGFSLKQSTWSMENATKMQKESEATAAE